MRIAWRFAAKYYLLTRNIVVSSPQFPGTAYKRKNSVMAQEIELKFIVAQDGVDALRQHLSTLEAKHTPAGQLLNIYYETADNWLRRHDMGLRIPEDVAVIGVDNVSMSAMVEPPLSTITQHLYDMGMEAAKSLIRQIEYKDKYGELPKPQRMIMNSDLIVRRSTK